MDGNPPERPLRTPREGEPIDRTTEAQTMPAQPRTDVHDLAAAYALDALDDEERQEFAAHLASCEACQHEIEGFAGTAALLATTVERTPPGDLRERILTAAARTRQEAPVVALASRRVRPSRFLSVAAALLLVATGALSVVTFQAQRRADHAGQVAAVAGAPDAQLVQLAVEGGGAATFVWSSRRDEGVLLGDDLAAPTDQQLALWLFHDEVPVLVASFAAADDGAPAAVVDGSVAGAEAVAITAEPLGEVGDAPQGPVVARATLT